MSLVPSQDEGPPDNPTRQVVGKDISGRQQEEAKLRGCLAARKADELKRAEERLAKEAKAEDGKNEGREARKPVYPERNSSPGQQRVGASPTSTFRPKDQDTNRRRLHPLPRIAPARHEVNKQADKEVRKILARPVFDISLPAAVSPFLGKSCDLTSPQTQSRLEFIHYWVTGGFDATKTVSRLVEQVRLMKESGFGIEDRLSGELSQIIDKGDIPLDDPRLTTSSLEQCNFFLDQIDGVLKKIEFQVDKFHRPPTLQPDFSDPYFEMIGPAEVAFGYLAAHLAYVEMTAMQARDYQEILRATEAYSLEKRLQAITGRCSLSERYRGDPTLAKQFLPELPNLFEDNGLANVQRWLMAFPPLPLRRAVLEQYKQVFSLFGESIGTLPPDGQINISLLVSPSTGTATGEKIGSAIIEYREQAERLALFYTTVYPRLIAAHFQFEPESDPDHLFSNLTGWIKRNVARLDYVTDRLTASSVCCIAKQPSKLEIDKPGQCIYHLGYLLDIFVSKDMQFFQSLVGLEEMDIFRLTKLVNPDYSVHKVDRLPSITEILIESLVSQGFLFKDEEKGGLYLDPALPKYVTGDWLARVLDLKRPEQKQELNRLLVSLTDESESVPSRFLARQDARDLICRQLRTGQTENKIPDCFWPWLVPEQMVTPSLASYNSFLEIDEPSWAWLCPTNGLSRYWENLRFILDRTNLAAGWENNEIFEYMQALVKLKKIELPLAGAELQAKKDNLRLRLQSLDEEVRSFQSQITTLEQDPDFIIPEDPLGPNIPESYWQWREKKEFLREAKKEKSNLQEKLARLSQTEDKAVGPQLPEEDQIPTADLITYWVRPYLASVQLAVMAQETDAETGTLSPKGAVQTARSEVLLKLQDIMRAIDSCADRQAKWSEVTRVLGEAENVLREFEDNMLSQKTSVTSKQDIVVQGLLPEPPRLAHSASEVSVKLVNLIVSSPGVLEAVSDQQLSDMAKVLAQLIRPEGIKGSLRQVADLLSGKRGLYTQALRLILEESHKRRAEDSSPD